MDSTTPSAERIEVMVRLEKINHDYYMNIHCNKHMCLYIFICVYTVLYDTDDHTIHYTIHIIHYYPICLILYTTYIYTILYYTVHIIHNHTILYYTIYYTLPPTYTQVMAVDEVTGEVTQKFLPEKQVRIKEYEYMYMYCCTIMI